MSLARLTKSVLTIRCKGIALPSGVGCQKLKGGGQGWSHVHSEPLYVMRTSDALVIQEACFPRVVLRGHRVHFGLLVLL